MRVMREKGIPVGVPASCGDFCGDLFTREEKWLSGGLVDFSRENGDEGCGAAGAVAGVGSIRRDRDDCAAALQ